MPHLSNLLPDRGIHASGECPQFTEDHEAFRQLARGFVEKEIGPHYDDWEKAGQMPDHRQVTRFVTGGEKILL
jgi:alkylation response protein AidB-like acyl-CoA dehydrogenase